MIRTRWFILIFAVALTCGCDSGKVEEVRQRSAHPDASKLLVHSVEGKLLVADRPASGARLAFHPVDGGVLRPVGVADSDGVFFLTTYSVGDGAPAGEYVVTVLWPNDTLPPDECEIINPVAHDRLGGLYLDATKSELRATVQSGHNTITLHATVGGSGWNLPPLRTGDRK